MTTPEALQRDKCELINRLLDDEYLLIHINLEVKGVRAPRYLYTEASATFKLSRMFSGGIEVTPEGVSAELLFDAAYFSCNFPMSSIWGTTDTKGESILWPEQAPQKVLAELLGSATHIAPAKLEAAKRIDAADEQVSTSSDNQESAQEAPQPKKSARERGHLRRVK